MCMGTFNYYNVRKNITGGFKTPSRNNPNLIAEQDIIETWAVAKRNASSYVYDLSHSDQSTWLNTLSELEHEQGERYHDLEAHTGHPPEVNVDRYRQPTSRISTSDLKFCIRDPLHRYISALCMITYDPLGCSMREMSMPRSYHAGGRENLEQNFNLENLLKYKSGPWSKQQRELYMWLTFVKYMKATICSTMNSSTLPDFTFGEGHLDPALSISALLPFVEPKATIRFVDIWKWTDYTTGVLGIPVEHETVDQWSGRKREGTVGKAQTQGKVMFSILQAELPHLFVKSDRAIQSPHNWKQNFEDWIKPEVELYEFFKANPIIAPDSVAKQELMELLVEQLKDPYFILRHGEIDKTFSNKDVRKRLPHELQVAISNTMQNSRSWIENWRNLNY